MKAHDLDPFSLVLGTVFALLGLAFLLLHVDPADLHLERVWPVPLIGLGLLIVLLAVASPRTRQDALLESESHSEDLEGLHRPDEAPPGDPST